jgi:hypothetical protein
MYACGVALGKAGRPDAKQGAPLPVVLGLAGDETDFKVE